MVKLLYDVQREMTFYRVAVDFRNAVEKMLVIRGRPLDQDYLWWGFGRAYGANPMEVRRGR